MATELTDEQFEAMMASGEIVPADDTTTTVSEGVGAVTPTTNVDGTTNAVPMEAREDFFSDADPGYADRVSGMMEQGALLEGKFGVPSVTGADLIPTKKETADLTEFGASMAGGPLLKGGKVAAAALTSAAGEGAMRRLNQAIGFRDPESVFSYANLGKDAINAALNWVIPTAARKVGEKIAGKTYQGEAVDSILDEQFSRSMRGDFAKTAISRASGEELRSSREWLQKSGALNIGEEFDAATGKFIASKIEPPKSLITVSERIQKVMNGGGGKPGLKEQRSAIDAQVDGVLNTIKAESNNAAIPELQGKRLWTAMSQNVERSRRLAESKLNKELGQEAVGELERVKAEIFGDSVITPSGLLDARGKALGPSAPSATVEISPKRANEMLEQIYAKQRSLEAYSAKSMDPNADRSVAGVEEIVNDGLAKMALDLRRFRDEGYKAIQARAGDKLKDFNPASVQNINDAIHHLSNFDRGINLWRSEVNRESSRLVQQQTAQPLGLSGFNTTASAMRTVDSKLGQLINGAPDKDVYDASVRTLSELQGVPQTLRTELDVGGQLAQSMPAVIGAREVGTSLLAPQEASAEPLLPTQIPQSSYPRDSRAIKENLGPFLQEVYQRLGPEMGGPVTNDLEQVFMQGTTSEQSQRLGIMIRSFPEIADLFEPSGSGFSSEFDGKLHEPQDFALASQQIEESGKSILIQARMYRDLWEKKKAPRLSQ